MSEPESGGIEAESDIHTINFIQLSRVYDVLMAILSHMDKDKASELLEAHANGVIYSTSPFFTGDFLTDLANANEHGKFENEQ